MAWNRFGESRTDEGNRARVVGPGAARSIFPLRIHSVSVFTWSSFPCLGC